MPGVPPVWMVGLGWLAFGLVVAEWAVNRQRMKTQEVTMDGPSYVSSWR